MNQELTDLERVLPQAVKLLEQGGKLAIISFHSLEDKIVKEIFRSKFKEGVITLPVKGTIKPSWEEVKSNPRARSAKMKVAEKL